MIVKCYIYINIKHFISYKIVNSQNNNDLVITFIFLYYNINIFKKFVWFNSFIYLVKTLVKSHILPTFVNYYLDLVEKNNFFIIYVNKKVELYNNIDYGIFSNVDICNRLNSILHY